jgi:hypothetical protein
MKNFKNATLAAALGLAAAVVAVPVLAGPVAAASAPQGPATSASAVTTKTNKIGPKKPIVPGDKPVKNATQKAAQ